MENVIIVENMAQQKQKSQMVHDDMYLKFKLLKFYSRKQNNFNDIGFVIFFLLLFLNPKKLYQTSPDRP